MMNIHRLFLLLSVGLSFAIVRSDYPPPSEDGHGYYSAYREGSEGSVSRQDAPGGGGRAGGMSFVGDWSDKDWQILSNYNQPKCLDIPTNLTLCRNIGYGQMRLPNLLEHDTLKEVTQQASSWVRLAHIGCHPDTQIFLCSLFAPVCLDQPVWPCQTLCEAVKSGCESKMLQYGFPWPDMLRCSKFPSATDLCIGIRSEQDVESNVGTTCPPCSPQPETADDVTSSLCQADFVIRAKVEQSLVAENDLKIVLSKKKKMFRSGLLKAKELREGVVYLEAGASCDCPVLDTVNGRRSSDHVIIAGNRTKDGRLIASFVRNVRSKNLRSILRDLRGKDACKPGQTSQGKPQKGKKNKEGKSDKTEEGADGQRNKQNKTTNVTIAPTKNPGKAGNKDGNRDGNKDGNKSNKKDGKKGNKKGNKSPESQKASNQQQQQQQQQQLQEIGKVKEERKPKLTTTTSKPVKKSTNHRKRPSVVTTELDHTT